MDERCLSEPRTERITMSCTASEKTDILKYAKQLAGGNVSDYLVNCALKNRFCMDAPGSIHYLRWLTRKLNSLDCAISEWSYIEHLPLIVDESTLLLNQAKQSQSNLAPIFSRLEAKIMELRKNYG